MAARECFTPEPPGPSNLKPAGSDVCVVLCYIIFVTICIFIVLVHKDCLSQEEIFHSPNMNSFPFIGSSDDIQFEGLANDEKDKIYQMVTDVRQKIDDILNRLQGGHETRDISHGAATGLAPPSAINANRRHSISVLVPPMVSSKGIKKTLIKII